MNGWRSDEEAIEKLRSMITDALKRLHENVPEHVHPLPDGAGGAVAFGWNEQDERCLLIFVWTDVPTGLQADL